MKYIDLMSASFVATFFAYMVYLIDLATSPDIFTVGYALITLGLACITVMFVRNEDRNKELEFLNQKS